MIVPVTDFFVKHLQLFPSKLLGAINIYRQKGKKYAIHPTIKFTFKYFKTSIDFLDTSIHIVQGEELLSKVYTKPIETFPLLDFKSNHPVETNDQLSTHKRVDTGPGCTTINIDSIH